MMKQLNTPHCHSTCISSWTTQQIESQGSLSIHSNGHRDLKITAGTGNSHFDSRGGVVGGTIDLNDLNLFGKFFTQNKSV